MRGSGTTLGRYDESAINLKKGPSLFRDVWSNLPDAHLVPMWDWWILRSEIAEGLATQNNLYSATLRALGEAFTP